MGKALEEKERREVGKALEEKERRESGKGFREEGEEGLDAKWKQWKVGVQKEGDIAREIGDFFVVVVTNKR